MAEETVGTARVDIKVNVAEFQAGVAAAKRSMKGLEGASKEVRDEYNKLTSAERKRVDSLVKQAEAFGLSKDAMLGYRIETRTTGKVQEYLKQQIISANSAAKAATTTFSQYGKSQKEIAAAMRGVPAQLTDIVVGLQSGQRPLTVLMQQGGQLKDMFGGVVPAAKALGSTLVGIVSPATVAAAALGTVAYAAYAGIKRDEQLNSAITMTGNAAGVTVSQLNSMVNSIGNATGSFSSAQDAVVQLAGNSKIAGDAFELVASAAVNMKDVTGQSIEDTISQFNKLADDPVKASQALDAQYHYLNASTFERIKALEDQGRQEEAAALAQKSYAQAMKERAEEVKANLNALGRAWAWVGEEASKAWRAMSSITQASTTEDLLKKYQERLADLGPAQTEAKKWLEDQISKLQKQIDSERKVTAEKQKQKAADDAAKAFIADSDKYLSDREKKDREHLKNLASINAQYKAANGLISESGYKSRIAKENSRYQASISKGGRKASSRKSVSLTPYITRADVSEIQDALRVERSSIQAQTTALDAAYRSGSMTAADYFSQKRDLANQDTEAQIKALEKQNAVLSKEKANGRDRINLQKQIASNTSKMQEVRSSAAAKLSKIDADETAAIRKRQAALLSYQNTLKDALNTTRTQYSREEASAWMGASALSYASGLNGIDDKVSSERRKLQSDRDQQTALGTWNKDDQEAYDQRLAALQGYQKKAVEAWDNHWKTLREGEENWVNGANAALDDYIESNRKVAGQAKEAFSNAFSSMEDSLVDFCVTGKGGFSDFATSVIKDIVRIQIRAAMSGLFKQVQGSGLFGSIASGVSSLFASANGNVFQSAGLHAYANQVVSRPTLFPFAKGVGLMGEAGPEAIMPLTRTSSGRLGVQAQGTAGAVNVVVNVSSDGTGTTKTSTTKNQDFSMGNALGRLVGTAVQSEMMNQMRPGGILWKWRAGRV